MVEKPNQYYPATKSIDYAYDYLDRRIKKVFDADGAGGGSAVTTHFVYQDHGVDVAFAFDSSNNILKRNLWAAAFQEVAEELASNNSILWGLGDNLGTIRDIINNSAAVQNHLKFNAFGDVTAETNAAIDYLMGFAATVRDEETGLAYAWHRYLQLGRWIGEDPITFRGGDSNLGRYCGNEPVNHSDATGLTIIPFPSEEELAAKQRWAEREKTWYGRLYNSVFSPENIRQMSVDMAIPQPPMLGMAAGPVRAGASALSAAAKPAVQAVEQKVASVVASTTEKAVAGVVSKGVVAATAPKAASTVASGAVAGGTVAPTTVAKVLPKLTGDGIGYYRKLLQNKKITEAALREMFDPKTVEDILARNAKALSNTHESQKIISSIQKTADKAAKAMQDFGEGKITQQKLMQELDKLESISKAQKGAAR